MLIQRKRIRSIEPYLGGFKSEQKLYICKQITEADKAVLMKYGYNPDDESLQTHEPTPIKRYTSINVDGDWIVHRDQPKEPREFERAYHIVDWHGNDHYGTCYQTRDCYPRTFIPPKLIELTLHDNMLRSSAYTNSPKHYESLTLVANMFLEMFGQCETMDENLVPVAPPSTLKQVSWTLLPVGKMPWDEGKERLKEIIQSVPASKQTVIEERHHKIWEYQPEWHAIGSEGFWGYVVYGFPAKNLYVFESNRYNNATYVFRGKWEEVSQLTKREIILGNMHEARIIHTESWKSSLTKLLNA